MNSESLRVLILTPSLPYPPTWGFGIRVYQMIRYLAARHRVTVLCYAEPGEEALTQGLRDSGAEVQTIIRQEPSSAGKRVRQLRSVIGHDSFQRLSLHSIEMQRAIDCLLARERFDIVQAESSQMCSFDFGPVTPLVLDEHNIEYELLFRTFKTESSLLRKAFNWIEYQKFRREEQSSWQQATGCILTSDREAGILAEHVPTQATVVPNGVDVEFFQPIHGQPDPDTMVFVGVMHYRPNVDAALYFIKDILPLIILERPNARLTIVGGGAPDELRRLAGPHVVFEDVVPDTRPYLSKSTVVVVPIRMGSGTRLKVLEGLAMQRPLVSTRLGCEGIGAISEEHLLIADDPTSFAHSVLRVLNDPELAAHLGRKGRALAVTDYSWPVVLDRWEAFIQGLRRGAVEPRPHSTVS